MKQALLLLLLFSFLQSAMAQDAGYSRWVYGVFGSPTICYRRLHTSPEEPALGSQKKSQDITRPSYDFGLTAAYYVNERISFQTGLEYADYGYKERSQVLTWSDGSSMVAHTSFHYRYLIVPLDLNYYFLEREYYRVYTSLGVSPAVFTGETTIFSYGSTRHTDSQPVGSDRFNAIADVKIGMDVKVSDRIQLTGGLFFKQFLHATNSNLPTREYLQSAGLLIGVSYYHYKHK